MNAVVSPTDPTIPATAPLLLRTEAAWLLDQLPLDELATAAGEGNRTGDWDAPAGSTPLTPTLHAAAAAAPAARLASSAARTGDRCIAGAERPTTTSGESRLVGTVGTG